MNRPLWRYVLRNVGCALLCLGSAALAAAALALVLVLLLHSHNWIPLGTLVVGAAVLVGAAAGYDDWRRNAF